MTFSVDSNEYIFDIETSFEIVPVSKKELLTIGQYKSILCLISVFNDLFGIKRRIQIVKAMFKYSNLYFRRKTN